MTADLLEILDRVVEDAEPGEHVEAFGIDESETTIRVHGGEVESLTSARTRGVGIRVLRDGRLGYCYAADLEPEVLRETLAEARGNATAATPDDANVLPDPRPVTDLDGLYDPAFDDTDPERKVATAIALEAAARAGDPRIKGVRMCQYGDGTRTAAIASTAGVRGSYRRCDAFVLVDALAEHDGSNASAFGLDYGRTLDSLDVETAGREAAVRAARLLGGRKPPSGKIAVVLDPFATASLLGVLAGALTAEAVQKGRSLFAERVGETLARDHVTLVDDGRRLDGTSAAPWDGEGVPTGRTTLIEGGVLQGWLHNTYTAARDGVASTGNATRGGHKSPPGLGPSNLYLEPGAAPPAEIMRQAGTAFYCQQVMGLHSGADPVSGDVSVGAAGLMIRGGELAEPVREATIAGTILDLLANLRAVGADLRFLPFGGGMGGATVLVDEMTLSGA
jgi:PmbA protein